MTYRLALVAALAATTAPALAAAPGLDWQLTPSQISQSCGAQVAAMKAAAHAILTAPRARSFQTVVQPLESASANFNDRLAAQWFLFFVSPDAKVRAASLACQTLLSDYLTELTADPKLYAAVAAAARSNTAKTVYDRKLTQLWLTSLKRSGAGLPAPARAEFVKLSKELTDLQNQFGQNLAEDKTTITISSSQTAGIPDDVLSSYTKNPDGSYTVPVNESTVSFLQDSQNEAARKAYYLAYNNRAAGTNTALLERAIAVRDRLAHLMGYETWAAYVLADRMASSPARVEKFLGSLDQQILPKARAELEMLRQLKAHDTRDPNAVLNPWDVTRYDYLLNKTLYAVDANAVRQYFPVQHTIDVVLNIYHTLLGVNFSQVVPANAWAPDVLEYKVTDGATGHLIGYTYFDLYPRPGKYQHFANFPILPVRIDNGVERAPVAAIVGNWPKPGAGNPALLSHGDVVTFFHEFGHNMATLLATAPYETLSAGFRQDFVEAPSQMLENFIWQPSILKQISSNVTTGAPLPDDLIAKLVAAKHVDYAYFTTRQILLSMVDMDYHTMGPHVDTTAIWDRVAREMTPLPMLAGTHPQASFGHLMGGYDAGYYGYLWSKVYAQDMFTAFLQGGLENPSVGMRYRRTILEPARTLEPDAEVRNFLGRPMNPNAFYEEFGITSSGGSN